MKKDNIKYRRASDSDSEAIKNILRETFNEYEISLPDDYSFSDVEEVEKNYIELNGEFIVLLKDNSIIGFFGLVPSGENFLELKRLYLTASERGKGLGRYLLNLAVSTAKNLGSNGLQLETSSKFIEAVSLYSKNGFIERPSAKMAEGHDIALVKYL
jgi:putative acetyltransferase